MLLSFRKINEYKLKACTEQDKKQTTDDDLVVEPDGAKPGACDPSDEDGQDPVNDVVVNCMKGCHVSCKACRRIEQDKKGCDAGGIFYRGPVGHDQDRGKKQSTPTADDP